MILPILDNEVVANNVARILFPVEDIGLIMSSYDSDDSCGSNVSSDSQLDNPLENAGPYKRAYRKLIVEFFPTTGKRKHEAEMPGMNHANFCSNYRKLVREEPQFKKKQRLLFTHIMCNQYARATGARTCNWEKHAQLAKYYARGHLRKYQPKARKPRSPSMESIASSVHNDEPQPKRTKLMAVLDDLSDSEEEEEEEEEIPEPIKTVQVSEILKVLKVDELEDVAKKAEVITYRMWTATHPDTIPESVTTVQPYAVYNYPDTPDTRDFIEESVKMSLFKLAQTAQKQHYGNLLVVKRKKQPQRERQAPSASPAISLSSTSHTSSRPPERSAPQFFNASNNNTGSGSNGEGEQVFWGDVLEEIGISEAISHRDDQEDLMKDIKMQCGAVYVRTYNGPERNPVTNRRVYRTENRANMIAIAKQVKTQMIARIS